MPALYQPPESHQATQQFSNITLVGLTANGAVDLGNRSVADIGSNNAEQYRGFGFQAAVVVGTNLGNLLNMDGGIINLRKLNVYLSGFGINKSFAHIDAKYFGVGAGAQYQIMRGANLAGKGVKWTGIEVGSGLLYTRLYVHGNIPLNKTYTATVGGVSVHCRCYRQPLPLPMYM